MTRKYKSLTDDDTDEMLAATLHVQERDHWMHSINLERYNNILALPNLSPAFRKRIEQLKTDTLSRIEEVESIMTGLEPQLPSEERLNKALEKLKTKKVPTEN